MAFNAVPDSLMQVYSLLIFSAMEDYMIKIYNKLVRDKIPDIIKDNNQIANYMVLSDEEYISELQKR